jgi:hypothetical protein
MTEKLNKKMKKKGKLTKSVCGDAGCDDFSGFVWGV